MVYNSSFILKFIQDMNTLKNICLGLALATLCVGCKRDPVTFTSGKADFSKFIAIGDSQTAGVANDGLYNDGISASFPSVMATQMKALGGKDFAQPLFPAGQQNGSGFLQLNGYTNGLANIIRITTNTAIAGTVTVSGKTVTLYTKYTGALNNLGVSGIKLADLNNPKLGNTNGYFERLLSASAPNNTTTYFDFISSKSYSFFSCWLGNNDVLSFATSGGASDTLTSHGTFNTLYTSLITKLTTAGQKGVVATIPDVSAIPYFTTVTVDSVNRLVKSVSPTAQGIYISAANTSSIGATYSTRLATKNDLIILSFDVTLIGKQVATNAGTLPYGLTPLTPIDNKYVLDKNEMALVQSYVADYNSIIKSIAASKGLAIFDAYSFFNNVKSGITVNGVKVDASFLNGGLFSLDGVHLTPRGYAFLANQFDTAINAKYGSALLAVDISKYAAVK